MADLFVRFPAITWGIVLLVALFGAAVVGSWLQNREVGARGEDKWEETQQGYVVAAVATMLAFMIGFTFSLALDRYEARRQLVGEHAQAIEELYLRAQILDEPHRSTLSNLLTRYADNAITLATLMPDRRQAASARNDQLIKQIWVATIPAFQSIRGIDFSSAFVDSANKVIELNAARITARNARVPVEVLAGLFIYAFGSALMLGYVLKGRKSRIAGASLVILYVMLMALLVDLNQPVTGFIRESQEPMQRMAAWLHANQPASFGQVATPAISSGTAK